VLDKSRGRSSVVQSPLSHHGRGKDEKKKTRKRASQKEVSRQEEKVREFGNSVIGKKTPRLRKE